MINLTITAWTGMTIRNIVHGPVLSELKNNFNVTLVSHYPKLLADDLPENTSGIYNTTIKVPRWQLPSLQSRLFNLVQEWNYHALWIQHKPTSQAKTINLERLSRPTRFLFHQIGGRAVLALRKLGQRDVLREIVYFLPVRKQFKDQDVVMVSTTDLQKDQMLIYSCRRAGLPIVALVHSWDNLYSRGLLPALPDRMLVWNEFMVEEAIELHGMPRDKIDVIGCPQYELYRSISKNTDRSRFLNRLNISETVKVLTFTAESIEGTPDEPYFVDAFVKLVKEGLFGDTVLIIRTHPSDRIDHYREKFDKSSSQIRLDIPDAGFAAENRWTVGKKESIKHFVELMQYSDVVITGGSTIALDAMLFDTPVIGIRFNMTINKESWNSARFGYQTSHFSRVANSGAIDFADDMDDLSSVIKHVLENPKKRSDKRRHLIETIVPNLPTAQLVVRAINRVVI
jgi:hypothetical protein